MGMMAGIGSLLGSGLSLFGGLEGMFGGNQASSVPLPPQQTIPLGGIESSLNSSIPQLGGYNLGGQNLPQYSNILQNNLNNPFASSGLSGIGGFAGQGMVNAATLGSQVPSFVGAGQNILQTGFDPQNALYNRTANQVSQQQIAGLEGSGIANTPWGQGVLGNTMSNFNIDWQNNQLGRQNTALGAYEQAIMGGGNAAQGAYGLGSAAAMSPYNTYNQITGNQLGALSGGASYGQAASNIPQTGIGDWLSYLQGGNQANQVANQQSQLALQQQQQQFNQNQIYGREIGQGLSGLGNWAGNQNWGGGGQPANFGYMSSNNYMNPQGFAIGGV